jgi:hypothetical protein
LESQQKLILNKGGSKSNKTNKTKKSKKSNKSKTKSKFKNQKGGSDPRIIIFFISLFFVFSKAIKNMTDSDVIQRIKEANNVSILFKNDYGTCALNSLLFLKTIDLPTFENLSIKRIQNKLKLTRYVTSQYLNKELDIYSKWFIISEISEKRNLRLEMDYYIEKYIDKIKNRLIALRNLYKFPLNQSIITEMNFPFKNSNKYHSVVVWLTSENDLVIIDPQEFIEVNEIVIYTNNQGIMFDDKLLKTKSLKAYIKNYINLFENTYLFESIHIEIEDLKLEQENTNLKKTISKIQQSKKQMENTKQLTIEEL